MPGDSWEVEEGMVIFIETVSSVNEYDEHYHLEDMVAVTKNGMEILSDYASLDALTVIV